jgi:hypothetical protein
MKFVYVSSRRCLDFFVETSKRHMLTSNGYRGATSC